MNLAEYESVKDLNYNQYCDYLQGKYGIGRADYMTKSFYINKKCKRSSEGLIAHHKAEDKMIMLCEKAVAEKYPLEWQRKENIVYCDYLEHLLLHVLICKYPSPDKIPDVDVGIGGIVAFIQPELNDVYSGFETKQEWRRICHRKIINDKDAYLAIMKQFIAYLKAERTYEKIKIFGSYNAPSGEWKYEYNIGIIMELNAIWESV